MADCFDSVPILSHDLKDQTLAWLRGRYGDSPQVALDRSKWRVGLVWEQSAAMSCGVRLLDEDGDPVVDFPVIIGWGSTEIPTKTNGSGWTDVPINGGNYSPPNKGPMFIRAVDGSWSYTGIGWRDATNHDHLNLNIVRGSYTPPPVTPPPTVPPVVPPSEPVPIVRIIIDVPESMSDTFRNLAAQATELARRGS